MIEHPVPALQVDALPYWRSLSQRSYNLGPRCTRIESCRGVYPIPRFGNCEVSIKLSREELSRSATRDLEDRIWQARLGLPIPFLPYHRSAPVAAASFREAIEHFSLGQRILANGVSYFPTLGRLLEECGHYWLPAIGSILVDVRRRVACVQQPLLGYNPLGHWGSSLWSMPRGVAPPPGLLVFTTKLYSIVAT